MNELKTSDKLIMFFIGLSFLQFSFFPVGRYIITFFSMIIAFIFIFKNSRLLISRIDLLYSFCFSFILLLLVISSDNSNEMIISLLKAIMIGIVFFVGKKVLLTKGSKVSLFIWVNLFSIFVLIVDFYNRASNFGISIDILSGNFHAFKNESLIFKDTNGVGFYALVVFAVNILLSSVVSKKIWFITQFIIAFFIVSTISRAAILSLSLCVIAYLYIMLTNRLKGTSKLSINILIFLLIIPIFIQILIDFYVFMQSDGSGASKLMIFDQLALKFGNDIFKDFFGRGLIIGGSYYSFEEGAYAHAVIPLLMGQIGVIGLIIYGFIVLYPLMVNFRYIYVFILFFTISFSYLEPFFEMLFLVVGLSLNDGMKFISDKN